MAKGPEGNFWNNVLKKRLKERKIFFTRIENMAGGGIPDLYFLYKGLPMWFELKYKDGLRIKPRKSQYVWHTKNWLSGGTSFYLAKHHGSRIISLYSGDRARDLMDKRAADVEHLYQGEDYDAMLESAWDLVSSRLEQALRPCGPAALRPGGLSQVQ